MSGGAGKHVSAPGLGTDIVHLGRDDQAVQDSGALITTRLLRVMQALYRHSMTTVGELRRSDANEFPLSSLVLAAALVEGALTFVVAHARKLDQGIFGSTDFGQDPKRWTLVDLVSGAARGGEHAVLDEITRRRADAVLKTRQRIHAGRMLSKYPGPLPVPDLRPEEARDGKAVTEQVVRRVLDWLVLHSPGGRADLLLRRRCP